jgi:hypothetical protein
MAFQVRKGIGVNNAHDRISMESSKMGSMRVQSKVGESVTIVVEAHKA